MKKIYISTFFIFIIISCLCFLSNKTNFRLVLEKRVSSSLYFKYNEKTIFDKRNEKNENLMYCENIVSDKLGVTCGFYINGKKIKIGKR